MGTRKIIKRSIGYAIIAVIVAFLLYCASMAAWSWFTLPEHGMQHTCVAEKVLHDPDTGKLDIASLILDDDTKDLHILYGMSCADFSHAVETGFIEQHPVMGGIGLLVCIILMAFILCIVGLFVIGGIVVGFGELVVDWINNGKSRKEI